MPHFYTGDGLLTCVSSTCYSACCLFAFCHLDWPARLLQIQQALGGDRRGCPKKCPLVQVKEELVLKVTNCPGPVHLLAKGKPGLLIYTVESGKFGIVFC